VTRRIRHIAVAAAVLSVAVVGLQSAWASYACRLDGQARAACCCPEQSHDEPADEQPRIDAASCCDFTVGEPARAPIAREADPTRAIDGPAVLAAVAAVAVAQPASLPPPTRIALARPPRPRVPTYLANRTILR
jgi:hypothetical protein